MAYRIDVTDRNGRAFIERMFNSRPFEKSGERVAVYGVALSGAKADLRNVKQNEQWLDLVDSALLSVAYQTKANFGQWLGESSEGGLLCLVDYVHGLAFEGQFLALAQELGEVSEEAVLVISHDPAQNLFRAQLLCPGANGLAYREALKTWKGGE